MFDKCEACGKWIDSADDCRLISHDGVKIHTFCKRCFELRGSRVVKKEILTKSSRF